MPHKTQFNTDWLKVLPRFNLSDEFPPGSTLNDKNKKYIISSTIILIVLLLVSCSFSNDIKVTIHNVSSSTINGVVVHVTGNSYPTGDIPAGSLKSIKVVSKGESNIEIEQKGVQKRLIVDCYFEKGYSGEILIKITPDQVVNIEDNISISPI